MPHSMDYPKNAQMRTQWIRHRREQIERPDLDSKASILHEEEMGSDGKLLDTGIIFLVNRECPWTCVMCDLWKNTSKAPMPSGHAAEQIKVALHQLEQKTKHSLKQVKLYNSGSFFDTKAIYPDDYESISKSLAGYERVIVENHPKLTGKHVENFNDLLKPQLEIAMGLEIANDDVLDKLNKRFSLDEYKKACDFFNKNSIEHRAFIMVQPPFISQDESLDICQETVEFAFDQKASCVTLIPSRATTGAMHALKEMGHFAQPTIKTLENCVKNALHNCRGRVFVDLWDLQMFSECDSCFESRRNRLDQMNRLQKYLPEIQCHNCLL